MQTQALFTLHIAIHIFRLFSQLMFIFLTFPADMNCNYVLSKSKENGNETMSLVIQWIVSHFLLEFEVK